METEPSPELSELEELGRKLATRNSVTHFARSFVLFCVSFVSLGVASRLLADSIRLPHFFWPIAAIGLLSLAGSLLSARKGRQLVVIERREFARYRELRAKAGVDP
ncbi:MAG: hypothetical protein ACOX6T_23575 [Myxococcales bacterium]|jgi:hypothetical protein